MGTGTPRTTGSKVTLQTVADVVGVSRMTVSNAFSRPDQLSAQLRARILAAADALGYVGPDPAARGLARGSVGAVGLLTPSLRHTFSDEISTRFLGAIARELAPTGLALTLLPTPEPADAAPAWDVAVDAAIVYSCLPGSPAIELLRRRRVPLVHVDQPPDDGAPSVNVDDRAGARAAARHLLDLGHRRIGIVTVGLGAGPGLDPRAPAELLAATAAHAPHQRLRGWLEVLDEAGVVPFVARQPDNYVDTDAGASALLAAAQPTAVLCFSDAVAEGTVRAARARGLRVPEDLSVVGFDDNGLAVWTDPPLTTVRQDVDAKGRAAVGALLDLLAARRARPADPTAGGGPAAPAAGPDPGAPTAGADPAAPTAGPDPGAPTAPHVTLPTELVVRGSTGPPPTATAPTPPTDHHRRDTPVTDKHVDTPTHPDADWWRQAVVYQVYPRTFADADGDGLGDIKGVTSRLDHLQRLGVDAVWLSPFYPSALADGGYDVDDYRDVDPRLGTLADVDEMIHEAHQRDIRVIVDIVPNHSSDRHAWFVEALAAEPGSPARERYVFRDGKGPDGAEPPTDWMSHFGGPAWTRVPDGQWYLHLFTREQPDFNWDNPEVREDFLRTLRFWSDRGVDGFRVDVAHALAKDLSDPLRDLGGRHPDALTELPMDGSHPYFDREEVHEIFRGWRRVLDEYDPPRSAVAEAWVANSRRVLYARPDELGQAFNFELVRAGWGAAQWHVVVDESLSAAQVAGASATWVLSNHDVVRHVSRYALPSGADLNAWLLSDGTDPEPDLERGLRRARAATLFMLSLPGSAYLYQGEELGLPEVADLAPEDLQDPIWERTGHREKGRDGCRVPLPWTEDGPSFGFGASDRPTLPQPDWFGGLSVEAQDGVPGSTLELYRDALRLRRELQGDESLRWLHDGDPTTTLHLRRSSGWECVTNFSDAPVPLPDGEVLLASGPLDDGALPAETTVWLRR